MQTKPAYRIREAIPSDLEEMLQMRGRLQDHFADSDERVLPLSPKSMADARALYTRRIESTAVSCAVAEHTATGTLVGMAIGSIHPPEGPVRSPSGHIDDVWVEPAHRHNGLCRALTRYVTVFFLERGLEQVGLSYLFANEKAARTWTRLGFVPFNVSAYAGTRALLDQLDGPNGGT